MRKILLVAAIAVIASTICFAQETTDQMSLNGVIVDCASAASHAADMAGFIASYSKEAALAPEAVKSGYGIFLDDGFMKFEPSGNAKVVEFLQKPESTLQARVVVFVKENDVLDLISIVNR